MKSWIVFLQKGVGFGEGAVPHPQFRIFFEISVLIWCILEAFKCGMLEIVTFL